MKDITYQNLRKFNLTMGILHFIQGIFMLVLSLTWSKIIEFTPTIWSYFLKFNPGSGLATNPKPLFDLPFGILVASFLFISAIAHFIISLPKKSNEIYNNDL